MQPASQNPEDYAVVKKLLALKRHEAPPPGYFDRLPGEVRARIDHAQAHPEPRWRQWLAAWNLSPTLATSYAAAVVMLAAGGVWLTRPSAPSGGQAVATVLPANMAATNQTAASNGAPTGLFNTPSLPVQPAEFKK